MHDGHRVVLRNVLAGAWDLVVVLLLADLDRWATLLARATGRPPVDQPFLLVVGAGIVGILAAMLLGRILLLLAERSPAVARALSRPLEGVGWRWLFGTLDPWASFRAIGTFVVTLGLVLGVAGEVLARAGFLPGPAYRGAGTFAWLVVAAAAIVAAVLAARWAVRRGHPGAERGA